MPSNRSADERAAVEKVRDALDRKDLSDKELVVFDDEPLYPGSLFKPGEPVTYGDLRTLLAVVARAGEPVAWVTKEGDKVHWEPRFPSEASCADYAARYGRGRSLTPMPLYAHPADARDRGDASADTRRLDWMLLDSFGQVIGGYDIEAHAFDEFAQSGGVAPKLQEDAGFNRVYLRHARAAIDHAMHAAPAAPEDK